MVSDGYWLAAQGHPWRRVRLEDYLTAAANAGLYQTITDLPPRDFADNASGVRGTTTDPNLEPHEIPRLSVPGRPVDLPTADQIRDAVAGLPIRDAFQPLLDAFVHATVDLARGLAVIRQALEEHRETPDA